MCMITTPIGTQIEVPRIVTAYCRVCKSEQRQFVEIAHERLRPFLDSNRGVLTTCCCICDQKNSGKNWSSC
jgi:hypothetical protein